MSDAPPRLIADPEIPPRKESDPDDPLLTEIDEPERDPGTDIVPPSPPDPPVRREGVVCDPDSALHSTKP